MISSILKVVVRCKNVTFFFLHFSLRFCWGRNFLQKSIQKDIKYTGPIYSSRSLQIRRVFSVKALDLLAWGANKTRSVWELCRTLQFWDFGTAPKTEFRYPVAKVLKLCVTGCTSCKQMRQFGLKNSSDLKRTRCVDGPSMVPVCFEYVCRKLWPDPICCQ